MTNPGIVNPSADPPLDPADPRISEWIDGRLSAAEAAAIEAAVGRSPALVRLVADLRAIKAAGRFVPSATPPAGFADRIVSSIGRPVADRTDPDRAVDDEWEAIEAERIAEERAEAAADVVGVDSPPSRRPWPWMVVVGALAAGLLVTVVLNLPGDGRRDLALAPAPTVAANRAAESMPAPAEFAAKSLRQGPEAIAPPGPRASYRANDAQRVEAQADRVAEADGVAEADADAVAVAVRGVAGRAAFERRAAALGLTVAAVGAERDRDEGESLVAGESLAREKSLPAGPPARRSRTGLPDVVAITGQADAIATLLAEARTPAKPGAFGREARLESADKLQRKRALEAGAAGGEEVAREVERAGRPDRSVARVLVRFIELPEPAAAAAPAAPPPGDRPAGAPALLGPGGEP